MAKLEVRFFAFFYFKDDKFIAWQIYFSIVKMLYTIYLKLNLPLLKGNLMIIKKSHLF